MHEIEVDIATFSKVIGVKVVFISNVSSGGTYRFEVTAPGKEKLEYELSEDFGSLTVLVGLNPSALKKDEMSQKIVRILPCNSFASGALLPNPVSWVNISTPAQRNMWGNGKFKMTNHGNPGTVFNFNQLQLEQASKKLLKGDQLNRLLRGEVISVFKPSEHYSTSSNKRRWLSTSDFELCKGAYYLIVNVRTKKDESYIKKEFEKYGGETKFIKARNGDHFIKTELKTLDMKEFKRLAVKFVNSYAQAMKIFKNHVVKQCPSAANVELLYLHRQENRLKLLRRDNDFLVRGCSVPLQLIKSDPHNGATTLLKYWYNKFASVARHDSVPVYATAREFCRIVRASRFGSLVDDIKYTIACILANTKFEIALTMKLFGKQHFTLLLDSIDDAVDEKKPSVKEILSTCKSGHIAKLRVIATCRTSFKYDMLEFLELKLIYELRHLTFRDCYDIIVKKGKDRTIQTAESILSHFRGLLKKQKFCFTPLFVQTIANLDETSTLTEAFNAFVETIFDRYAQEKINDETLRDMVRQDFLKAHIHLATKQLSLGIVGSVVDDIYPNYLENKLTASQGLLKNIDPPLFIHNLFAEHFLNMWIKDILTGKTTLQTDAHLDLFQRQLTCKKQNKGVVYWIDVTLGFMKSLSDVTLSDNVVKVLDNDTKELL